MATMNLAVAPGVLRKLKSEAKKLHPKESWVVLLGPEHPSTVIISDTWIPPDMQTRAQPDRVEFTKEWFIQANEYAIEQDLQVWGSAHSHPYTMQELSNSPYNLLELAGPSKGDWECGWSNIWGITAIVKLDSGRFSSKTRFYGPITNLNLVPYHGR